MPKIEGEKVVKILKKKNMTEILSQKILQNERTLTKTRKIKFCYQHKYCCNPPPPTLKRWGLNFKISPEKGTQIFSIRRGGLLKEMVLFQNEEGVHPGPNLGTLCMQRLDASLTLINSKTFIRFEKPQKHIR